MGQPGMLVLVPKETLPVVPRDVGGGTQRMLTVPKDFG